MSDADRLARVALSRLTEPGEPKIAALVAQMGAVALLEALSDPAQPSDEARDVASRLRGLDAEGDLAHGAGWACATSYPAIPSGPPRSTT